MGFRSNHSLRAASATRLFSTGTDEQLIMERTGHRSVDGIRSYKRTSESLQESVSDILHSSEKRNTNLPDPASLPSEPQEPYPIAPLQSYAFEPSYSSSQLPFMPPPSLVPRPSRAPARKEGLELSQDFLALLSQHVRKTGKPIRTQDSKQSCDFNAYWNTTRFQFQLPSVYARIGIGPYAQST